LEKYIYFILFKWQLEQKNQPSRSVATDMSLITQNLRLQRDRKNHLQFVFIILFHFTFFLLALCWFTEHMQPFFSALRVRASQQINSEKKHQLSHQIKTCNIRILLTYIYPNISVANDVIVSHVEAGFWRFAQQERGRKKTKRNKNLSSSAPMIIGYISTVMMTTTSTMTIIIKMKRMENPLVNLFPSQS
jgi:hypothetical protein